MVKVAHASRSLVCTCYDWRSKASSRLKISVNHPCRFEAFFPPRRNYSVSGSDEGLS